MAAGTLVEADAAPAGNRSVEGVEGPDRPPVLRVLDLRKTYRSGFWRRPCAAVRGLSFTVAAGTVHALLGHNGAGKTTTMKAILGLVHADGGRVEIFGRDWRRREARAAVGYLPEAPHFYEHLDARELLDFHGRLCGLAPRDRRRRADELLALVGLERRRGLPLRKYSKGMLQRVGLAQALLHDPDLLILDEPMSGLDPAGRREVRELLAGLRAAGKTILLSSHIVPDIEALADSVGIVASGRLVAEVGLAGAAARRFEVVLPELPAGPEADGALRGCAVGDAVRPGGPRLVTAPDETALQRLLAACVGAGVRVLDLRTRRADLEELFLASIARAAADGGTTGSGPDGARVGGGGSRTAARGPAGAGGPPDGARVVPGLTAGGRPW